jgi:hypothetical protein
MNVVFMAKWFCSLLATQIDLHNFGHLYDTMTPYLLVMVISIIIKDQGALSYVPSIHPVQMSKSQREASYGWRPTQHGELKSPLAKLRGSFLFPAESWQILWPCWCPPSWLAPSETSGSAAVVFLTAIRFLCAVENSLSY